MEPIRVVLAEDSLLVRAGLESLLQTTAGVELVAICTSLDELLEAVERTGPDVVLTDIRMPPTHRDEGIQAAVALRRTHPDTGVVVLSHYLDPAQALALVDKGTSRRGYLLKERLADTDELLAAIGAVAEGHSHIDQMVVTALFDARRGSSLDRLTRREREILKQIATGKSNGAVAGTLGVTVRAVEKHINAIFSKLDLSDATDTDRRVASVLVYLAGRDDGGAGTIAPRPGPR